MLRWVCLLAATTVLLGACASPTRPVTTSSPYQCDRNGDREQRVAC